MEISADFNKPGMVPVPVGPGLWMSVRPWPEYSDCGRPTWGVRVVGGRPVRRYGLVWSARLGRWVTSAEHSRMARDLAPEQVQAVTAALHDVLEGSLC